MFLKSLFFQAHPIFHYIDPDMPLESQCLINIIILSLIFLTLQNQRRRGFYNSYQILSFLSLKPKRNTKYSSESMTT